MIAKMRQRTVLALVALATLETGGAYGSPVADRCTSALLRAMGAYLGVVVFIVGVLLREHPSWPSLSKAQR
jgi:hypothetical protein